MLKYWVWLAELPRLKGPFRLALLRHFGSPEDIFFADREELLLAEDVPPGQAELALNRDLSAADRILADCQRLGQRILTIQDAEYPQRLRNIFDPPLVLYVKGRMPVMDEEAAIAVVGTRECTPYGTACGERLGRELADTDASRSPQAVVVTGLARGVDSAAARGALRAGGSVVGVTGGGLDVVYPPENGDLYADVAARGVLLSEYPPGSPPDKAHFPVRNRIMSGLSVAALVVEAPERSGALITARLALEQGREVYAVPGPIDAPDSVGCNRLIRDGAGLAAEGWDILRDFQERFPEKLRPARKLPAWTPLPTRRRAEPRRKPEPAPEPEKAPALRAVSREGLTDDQIALLGVLEPEQHPKKGDLIESTGIPARRVSSALTMLEIDGCVRQHDGKRYTRTVALTE